MATGFSSLTDFQQDVLVGLAVVAVMGPFSIWSLWRPKKILNKTKQNFAYLTNQFGLQIGPLPEEIKAPPKGFEIRYAKGILRGRMASMGNFILPSLPGQDGCISVEVQNLQGFIFTVVQSGDAYKNFGKEERVLTGDAAFDKAFILKSNNSARAKAVFTAKIRDNLLEARLPQPFGVLQSREKYICYFESAAFYNRKAPLRHVQFGEMLYLLCDIAERVEQSAE